MSSTPAVHGPLFIVFNAAAGKQSAAEIRAVIEDVLRAAGREFHITLVDDATQLENAAHTAVTQALASGGAVVAAGGDGTINTVARACLEGGCPLGVLAQGTFNYFSREHGLPADTAEATRLLLGARPQPVQVGLINDRPFLVNASIGLYPRLLEDRELHKQRFGRSRLVAFGAGLLALLQEFRPLHLHFAQAEQTHTLRTPTLFVGNNRLQLQQLGIREADALQHGQLAAITVRPVSRRSMLWLLLRGALGRLGAAEAVTSLGIRHLVVRPARRLHRGHIKVATDGEVSWMRFPLCFRVAAQPLLLLKGEAGDGDKADASRLGEGGPT